jgi:hypothetical protein
MKTVKSILIALTITFISSFALTGCFVEDEDIQPQIESAEGPSQDETNSEEWGD